MENPFDPPPPLRFPRLVTGLLVVIALNLTVQTACSIVNTSPWTMTVLQTWFSAPASSATAIDDAAKEFRRLAAQPRK